MEIQFFGMSDRRVREIFLTELKHASGRLNSVSISWNHDTRFPLPNAEYRVLLLLEPSVVMPWQYRSKVRHMFDLVVPMSPWRAKRLGYMEFAYQPYSPPSEIYSPFRKRNKKIVLINAAKFSASNSSNYGLRRNVISALSKSNCNFEYFGPNWDMSRYDELVRRLAALRNSLKAREKVSLRELTSNLFKRFSGYQGTISNKFEVLSDSEMSLIIENESDTVTEKLFDSILAGAIPIYVGPDFSVEFPELESCIIRARSTPESIIDILREVTSKELDEKRVNIVNFQNFKGNKGIEFWSEENQWKQTARLIAKKIAISFPN